MVNYATAQVQQTIFQNGAFRYELIVGWLNLLNETQALPLALNNEGLTPFWESQDMTNKWNKVNFPVIHVTAW